MSEAWALQRAGRPHDKRQGLAPRKKHGGTAYIDAGSGEPVVLIHGVGLNADAWQPQIRELAKTHHVIAIDMLGHGESAAASGAVTLDSYVKQVADLMTACGIASANVIGHSMGGLVAIGFALAHPARALRLAVLNSVYRRSAENRAAVAARAQEISRSEAAGNIEEPLERWFGPTRQQPALAQDVRAWLASANPQGYAAAYSIFAASDEAFAGRLQGLSMPALFATGSLDLNSSPAMAGAMANEARRGRLLVVEGARHLMNLTHPDAVTAALHDLLHEPVTAFDLRDLRKAFGSFMTGVTVVTTREANSGLRGFTANSFSSVSLDPPLLLVCVNKASASCEAFSSAENFAVNVLSESQKEISGIFASKRSDKFANATFTLSASGNPLLTGSLAWFDCARHDVIDAGDHMILIGRVTSYSQTDANPLGYARGGYVTLGLEQSAVNAAAQAGRTEVGAILECDGKLLVFPAANGKYELPHVGRSGEAGTASRLQAHLASKGINAKLGFLFAVYENKEDQTQSIYYRGDAEPGGNGAATLLSFDALPWENFRDDATRSMLRRYSQERLQGRYRIYSGDHVSGDVRDVSEGPGA